MSDATPDRSRTARFQAVGDASGWEQPAGKKYRCEVHLYPRNGAGYLAVAAALPAVAAVGATEAEALAEITKAFAEAIRSYTTDGGRIPWLPEPPAPQPGGITRFVFPQV